jgi:DNA-binding NarL/FixJ family response regulator
MRRLLIAEQNQVVIQSWRAVLSQPDYEVTLIQDLHRAQRWIENASRPACDFAVVNTDLQFYSAVLRVLTTFRPIPQIVSVSENLDGPRALSLLEHCRLVLPAPVDGATLSRAFGMLEANLQENSLVGGFARAHALSPREAEILRSVLMGLSTKEIAFDIGCGRSTVSTHLQRIFGKTKTHSQRQLLVSVLRHAIAPLALRRLSGVACDL